MRARWRPRVALGTMAGMSDQAPEHSPVELYRLLANLIREGRVEEVRPGRPARCRVRAGELLTNWVPWISLAAGGGQQTRHWRVPAIGEPCLLFAPGGDLGQASALVGSFSEDMPQGAESADVERHDFNATDYWEHNRQDGTLVFDIGQAITLRVGASTLHITPEGTTLTTPEYTVDSAQSTFNGKVTVAGLFTYQSGIAGSVGTSGGTNTIAGGFKVEGGQITHDGKNIGSTHVHPDPHGGNTGGPQ